MAESGRKALTEGRLALPKGWQWPGGPPGGPRVVWRPSQRVGSLPGWPGLVGSGWQALTEGQKDLPNGQEWLEGPH